MIAWEAEIEWNNKPKILQIFALKNKGNFYFSMKIFAIFFRKNSYCVNLSEELFFFKCDIVSSPGCNENKNVVKDITIHADM